MRTSVLLTMVRYFRYGSSALSAVGARSNCRPVAAGDHMFIVAPSSLHPAAPCTISIATSRVRSGARRLARPTGTIASRNGNANVAPRLCTNARRGSGFPVRKCMDLILPSSLGLPAARRTLRVLNLWDFARRALLILIRRGGGHRHAPRSERVARHDAEHEIRELVAARLRVAHDAADRRPVVVLHAPAEAVGHEVRGERAEDWLRPLEQHLLQLRRRRDRCAVVEVTTRVERRAVLANAPLTGHVEVVEREADGIHEE